MSLTPCRSAAIIRLGNAAIITALALYALVIPGLLVVRDLSDPALRGPGIPRCAWRWHRALSPRYERWARARVAAGRARELDTEDISGTEWPVFGSAFYLWATEALQEAWERDRGPSSRAPADYARGAIEAAAELIADPNHAHWVAEHWGADYLRRENVFYRMLLIAGLTSHHRLVGGDRYLPVLREQVESLSRELDESRWGLLDDYPGECYPGDVVAAIAAIRRADPVLGTDHAAFAVRSLRGFEGDRLAPPGLPPYRADAVVGRPIGPARGCANSYILTFAPQLWPEAAHGWYALYEAHFWQRRWTAVGFREFARDVPGRDWYVDVDSGPVVVGHGISACAFGVAAARTNGRFDHAYPLSAEMLLACCPLADGTLLGPRLLSNAADAPYLGESAVLFCLTRQPAEGMAVVSGGRLPPFVFIVLGLMIGGGALLILAQALSLRRRLRRLAGGTCRAGRAQLAIWGLLIVSGAVVAATLNFAVGLLLILLAQFLPKGEQRPVTVTSRQGE